MSAHTKEPVVSNKAYLYYVLAVNSFMLLLLAWNMYSPLLYNRKESFVFHLLLLSIQIWALLKLRHNAAKASSRRYRPFTWGVVFGTIIYLLVFLHGIASPTTNTHSLPYVAVYAIAHIVVIVGAWRMYKAGMKRISDESKYSKPKPHGDTHGHAAKHAPKQPAHEVTPKVSVHTEDRSPARY